MEHILENLVNYIGEQMPEMKTVDEDYGQLEMIDETTRESYPLTFPAVLIDAAETSWSNVLGLSQEGVCTVRVRLIIDCYDDTHYRSGTVEKIKERDDIRRRLHLLVQGHEIEGSTLIRTNSRFYTANHGIKVRGYLHGESNGILYTRRTESARCEDKHYPSIKTIAEGSAECVVRKSFSAHVFLPLPTA